MAKQQAITRTAKGLFTQYNRFHESPEGGLRVAENVVLDRDGSLSRRRGFALYGGAFSPSALFRFQGKLLGLTGTTLRYDADGLGTWASHASPFSPPDTTVRMRSAEARKALYITTSKGIYRTDDVAAEPIPAGMPNSLDTELELNGTGTGWFTPNGQVGYRIVWGRVDGNEQLLLGAPSFREVVVNAYVPATWAFAAATVTVTQTGHGYETGDTVMATGLSDAAAAVNSTIIRTGADTYTYTPTGTPAATGTGSYAKKQNVLIRFTVPRMMRAGDFWEIYRTAASASSAVDPGDEEMRVVRFPLTDIALQNQACTCTRTGTTVTVTLTGHTLVVGDIFTVSSPSDALYEAGPHIVTSIGANVFTYTVVGAPATPGTMNILANTITYVDGLDEAFLGERLYTNPTRLGIEAANTRPPRCRDIALYKGMLFGINTDKEHFIDLQFLTTTGLVDDTSAIKLTTGGTTLTYTFSTAENYIARKFKRYTTFPTLAQNIRATMQSLCRVINRDSLQSSYLAWYTSGINEQPGIITIEAMALGSAAFTVTCNNTTTAIKFAPNLPTSGTLMASSNMALENGICYSKVEEADHIPDSYIEEIGDPSKKGLRLIATRDSLLAIKEDGIWRISGDTPLNFVIKPLDLTVQPRCPETWRALDGAVWGLTTKGVVRVTESGTDLMSQTVADDVREILSFLNAETLTHAIAYESEFKYLLCAQEVGTDLTCKIIWVFNSFGETGPTIWRKQTTTGLVSPETDLLEISAPDVGYVLKERKGFTTTDFMDQDRPGTVTVVGTYIDAAGLTKSSATVVFTYRQIKDGDGFLRTPPSLPWSKIRKASMVGPDTYDIELDDYFPGLDPGPCQVSESIPAIIEWKPEVADSCGVLKLWSSVALHLEEDLTTRHQLSFYSNYWGSHVMLNEISQVAQAGGMGTVQVPVPRQVCRSTCLSLIYQNDVALEDFAIAQVTYNFRPTSDVLSR